MKTNNRKVVYIILAIMVIFIIAIVIKIKGRERTIADKNTQDEPQVTVIKTAKLDETKIYQGLEISNIEFKIQDKTTIVKADVLNNTGADLKRTWVNIDVLDKEGNKVTSVGGCIDPVKAGETTPITSSILSNGKDLNAYDIEITPKQEKSINDNIEGNTAN